MGLSILMWKATWCGLYKLNLCGQQKYLIGMGDRFFDEKKEIENDKIIKILSVTGM